MNGFRNLKTAKAQLTLSTKLNVKIMKIIDDKQIQIAVESLNIAWQQIKTDGVEKHFDFWHTPKTKLAASLNAQIEILQTFGFKVWKNHATGNYTID